jgi:hypothetical protein
MAGLALPVGWRPRACARAEGLGRRHRAGPAVGWRGQDSHRAHGSDTDVPLSAGCPLQAEADRPAGPPATSVEPQGTRPTRCGLNLIRQAKSALWRTALVRMGCRQPLPQALHRPRGLSRAVRSRYSPGTKSERLTGHASIAGSVCSCLAVCVSQPTRVDWLSAGVTTTQLRSAGHHASG